MADPTDRPHHRGVRVRPRFELMFYFPEIMLKIIGPPEVRAALGSS